MKHFFLSLVFLFGTTGVVLADSYNYLTLVSANIESSVALRTIKRITFSDGNLVVTSIDGEQTLTPLTTLSELTFTSEPTAIRSIGTKASDLCIEAGKVVANGAGMLLLYNTNGQLMRQQYVKSQRTELSLDELPHGIYIARLGNRILKIQH